MENRTRIGIYYVVDKSWMGGVLYIQNLLKSLNTLCDSDKPYIDVYCRDNYSYDELKVNTGYPYLKLNLINDNSFFKKVFRKLVTIFLGEKANACINRFRINPADVMVYPLGVGSNPDKLVYWRPDFQEKYLPELFDSKTIIERDRYIRKVAERGVPIVFSSYCSKNDYKRFYPEYTNKTFVIHFAVNHADFSSLDINVIKTKYGIEGEYLLCANQFWKHKNHLFLFKAYKKAIEKGLKLQLVCTGNMSDYRNPEYVNELKDYLGSQDLYGHVILPGLIDSDELHCLMQNAYAVIQPSLFEGWNTTVEDCKALNKFIFLSNLPVHQEQIKENVCFFAPDNVDDLVCKLIHVNPIVTPVDYTRNLYEFRDNFLEVVKYVHDKNNYN